jgi:hypothetical protein
VLGDRVAGPAIRAWKVAEVLAAAGHEVRLGTLVDCTARAEGFAVRHVGAAELRDDERWCDVLVFQGSLLHEHPFLAAGETPLVADLYDPFHLELLEQARDEGERRRRDIVHNAVVVLGDQLRRGDFFLCASEKQRDFWLGALAALGRVNPVSYDDDETLRSLLAVAPFGLDPRPPVRTGPGVRGVVDGIGPADELILWAGGIYNWFDPLTLIRAVDLLRRERPALRLFFMGLAHPNPRVPEMRMATEAQKLAAELGRPARTCSSTPAGCRSTSGRTCCWTPTSPSPPTSTTRRPRTRSGPGCSTTSGPGCPPWRPGVTRSPS